MKKKGLFNVIALLLCAMIWGFAFTAQSVGAEYVGPWTFLAARAWIGVATLLCFIGIRKLVVLGTDDGRRASEDAKKMLSGAESDNGRKLMLIAGASTGILLAIASYLQQKGIAYTTVARSSFITAMYVVIVPLLSMLFGRRPGLKIWVSVVLSVAGLYMLSFTGGIGRIGLGDILTLGCAAVFSLQIMCVNHFVDRLDGLLLSCTEFLFEALLSTCCMLIFEKPELSAIMAASGAILYAGIMSNGIAYTLQIIGQKGFDPAIASMCMCMESVFGALGGFIILGQTMTLREAAGCALMFVAILIAEISFARPAVA